MQPPPIERQAFSLSRTRLARRYRNLLVLICLMMVVAWAVSAYPHETWERLPLSLGRFAAVFLFLAAAIWLRFRLRIKQLRDFDPILVIGPEGIDDRANLRNPIPWAQIKHISAETMDLETYSGFKVAIRGRNDLSKSALLRFVDNFLLRPIGNDPSFSVSFEELEADERQVDALVRNIVAAAKVGC